MFVKYQITDKWISWWWWGVTMEWPSPGMGKCEFPWTLPISRSPLAHVADVCGGCTLWSDLVQLGKDLVTAFSGVFTLTLAFLALRPPESLACPSPGSGPPVTLITFYGGTMASLLVCNSAAFWFSPGGLPKAIPVSPRCGCISPFEHSVLPSLL